MQTKQLYGQTLVRGAFALATILGLSQGLKAAFAEEAPPYQVIQVKSYAGKSLSPQAKQGKELFAKNHCASCHSVDNKGGCLAPPLDGIGAYRQKPYLLARITLGDRFRKDFEVYHKDAELMPHPRLPVSQSRLIAEYLLTLPSPKEGYKIYGHASESSEEKLTTAGTRLPGDMKQAEEGRKLFLGAGCLACHSVGNTGGRLAPNLGDIGSRQTYDFIERRISKAEIFGLTDNSEYAERGTVMPPSGLTPEQVKKIAVFLTTLKK